MTCHCGAPALIAPVRIGRGLVLFYCEPCAREVVGDLERRASRTGERVKLSTILTSCICGSKYVALSLALRAGAAFSLCDRCADDLEEGFRKVLAA